MLQQLPSDQRQVHQPDQQPDQKPQPPTRTETRREQTLKAALADPGAREPLPLSVRARLAPLLGRDLGSAQLLRNAAAADATTAAAADALAVGDTVLLSPGQDLASARGLGLLAHELTHVLRQRDPGFVPAVVRASQSGARKTQFGTGQASAGQASTGPPGLPSPGFSLDEEGLAEQVEGLVRSQLELRGQSGSARAGAAATRPVAQTINGQTMPGQPKPLSRQEPPWGGLPAPWEAMPYWDTQPAASAGPPRPSAPAQTRAADRTGSGSGSGNPASQGASSLSSPAPLAQAASTSRSVSSSGSANESAGPALPAVGSDRNRARSTPDLDRLAQQVYSLIKGRLHTEIRRDR